MEMLPAEVRHELVTTAAVLDRHAVTMHRLRSAEPPETLAATLRERWRATGAPFVESRVGPWTVLSTRDAAGIRTIQLRATASGTEGVSSHWQVAPVDPARGPQVSTAAASDAERWLPPGTRVLRRLVHGDPGRDALTLVGLAAGGPEATAAALRDRVRADGFDEDLRLGLPAGRAAWYRGGPDAGGAALAFRRGRDELVVTLAAHADGTALVLHWGSSR
jgi:hypothetical protein